MVLHIFFRCVFSKTLDYSKQKLPDLMNRNASFSMEVTGAGDLLGMFITEAQRFFPNVRIYDRSDLTNQARVNEAVLGLHGHLHPSQRPATDRLIDNLSGRTEAFGMGRSQVAARHRHDPYATDVTVVFSAVGSTQQIEIKGKRRQQLLHHNMVGATLPATQHFIQKALRTAKRLV